MDLDALARLIDDFNDQNDELAVTLNFVAAGIASLQSAIRAIEDRTGTEQELRPQLREALQMLDFSAERLAERQALEPIASFVDRYRNLVGALEAAL